MGYTIEDMLVVSQEKYQMELIAGHSGWSNSISWLLMLEDVTIIHNFRGKELAVTTGLGFQTEESLLELVELLSEKSASGLIINTGYYIKIIPKSVTDYCNENGLPLLTVPWDVFLADMIKDLSIRVFLQSSTDEQISAALINAIRHPEEKDRYAHDLLPYFDIDGTFQVSLITTGELDKMDTVERRRIAYRMQLYLTNLTHNGHFFYYDSYFVVVINAVTEKEVREIIDSFHRRLQQKMPETHLWIGVSNQVADISNLQVAYMRAKAAVSMAQDQNKTLQYFDRMGTYQLLYSISDRNLLKEFSESRLQPLISYDEEHNANYVETLEVYLMCGGSFQAMASQMFVHRNTILYRMNNIKQLLGCDLETTEEKLPYLLACMIRHMG
ncbi:MAG: PucR family transcriptional regulator ligand-binding domain-containing protein [Blautia sp.]|nr:PucR family transcriptional regulator ligand-binding domain-containing protein [Blautia sp.]